MSDFAWLLERIIHDSKRKGREREHNQDCPTKHKLLKIMACDAFTVKITLDFMDEICGL